MLSFLSTSSPPLSRFSSLLHIPNSPFTLPFTLQLLLPSACSCLSPTPSLHPPHPSVPLSLSLSVMSLAGARARGGWSSDDQGARWSRRDPPEPQRPHRHPRHSPAAEEHGRPGENPVSTRSRRVKNTHRRSQEKGCRVTMSSDVGWPGLVLNVLIPCMRHCWVTYSMQRVRPPRFTESYSGLYCSIEILFLISFVDDNHGCRVTAITTLVSFLYAKRILSQLNARLFCSSSP